jgi:hypothetical protein
MSSIEEESDQLLGFGHGVPMLQNTISFDFRPPETYTVTKKAPFASGKRGFPYIN